MICFANTKEEAKTSAEKPDANATDANAPSANATDLKEIPNSGLVDSGKRHSFGDGENSAQREPTVGEGRCDLLPLGVMAGYFKSPCSGVPEGENISKILQCIRCFKITSDVDYLYCALRSFGALTGMGTGQLFLEISKQSEAGAVKYSDNNYAHDPGIPVSNYIDHAIRHLLKYIDKRTDEPHDRAFCWNIATCIWTVVNKPAMNDLNTSVDSPCPKKLQKDVLERYEVEDVW